MKRWLLCCGPKHREQYWTGEWAPAEGFLIPQTTRHPLYGRRFQTARHAYTLAGGFGGLFQDWRVVCR